MQGITAGATVILPIENRVNPIRVYFGPMPEMLRTIIGDLLGREPDILIVGRSENNDCLREAHEANADVIIAQDSVRAGGACLDLILAGPPLGVLAVSTDGQSAAGVSLVRRPIILDSGSPSVFAGAIRRIAQELILPSPKLAARELNNGPKSDVPHRISGSSAGNGGDSP